MKKRLSEMTLEELWQLFPIFLTEHKYYWRQWYEEERTFLCSIMPMERIISINHIGSTAIDNIWAKPIIDILVEVRSDMREVSRSLTKSGYICMSESDSRISLNKGYTEDGFSERVFHIHLRYSGDMDELYFRDYLNNNRKIAAEYEKMKLELAKKYKHNRDAYTDAKSEFILKYTKEAKCIKMSD